MCNRLRDALQHRGAHVEEGRRVPRENRHLFKRAESTSTIIQQSPRKSVIHDAHKLHVPIRVGRPIHTNHVLDDRHRFFACKSPLSQTSAFTTAPMSAIARCTKVHAALRTCACGRRTPSLKSHCNAPRIDARVQPSGRTRSLNKKQLASNSSLDPYDSAVTVPVCIVMHQSFEIRRSLRERAENDSLQIRDRLQTLRAVASMRVESRRMEKHAQ